MKKLFLFIPLALFLIIVAIFATQLQRNAQGEDPKALESALIGKPLPPFKLESLQQPGHYYQPADLFTNQAMLINVWATWCPSCYREHQYLNQLASQGIKIVGLNYKDDRNKAQQWLDKLGNPYALSLYDNDGLLGLDLGVYGAPETFLIDKKGIIRFRLAGELTPEIWSSQLQPLWLKYQE